MTKPAYVACVGERATALVADALPTLSLTPDAGRARDRLGPGVRVLAIDAGAGASRAWLEDAVRAARVAGAAIVGVRDGGKAPTWAGLVDAECAPEPRLAPSVDPAGWNPIGFQTNTARRLAVVADVPVDAAVRAEVDAGAARTGRWSDVSVLAPEDQPPATADLVEALRPFAAVLDLPVLHASPRARAQRLLGLAAAGVPVVVEALGEPERALLGEALAALLEAWTFDVVDDQQARDEHSVRVRRVTLTDHAPAARWRALAAMSGRPVPPDPSVSVVLVTNRPHYLEHAAAEIARQAYPRLEVVAVLHGSAFAADAGERLRAALPVPVVVLHAPNGTTLGSALNQGVAAASGDLVTKWDDDDWYGPDHLADLVLARAYSGAQLVGKQPEHVYLGELDVTIRRFPDGGERWFADSVIAGGTMMIARDDLHDVGGFRDVPRAVDQRLLEDVRASGAAAYRTHGFGYVMNRHGTGHTWSPEVDYFLQRSERQWRGLRLDLAGVLA